MTPQDGLFEDHPIDNAHFVALIPKPKIPRATLDDVVPPGRWTPCPLGVAHRTLRSLLHTAWLDVLPSDCGHEECSPACRTKAEIARAREVGRVMDALTKADKVVYEQHYLHCTAEYVDEHGNGLDRFAENAPPHPCSG